MKFRVLSPALAMLLISPGNLLHAQQPSSQLSPELKTRVDAAVQQVLQKTGVPSASVGIVEHGQIVYTAAYGHARIQPPVPASPAMHYAIGSISKQFTTACVLLLAQDGRLKLDDPVARWFPDLTQAGKVTIRNLLTHTSGYEDYAPQDYTIPAWTKPTRATDIIDVWAKKPLDFEPGTRWQYSNTNFVLAALIVEKASGMSFWQFLQSRVLQPLQLNDVLNLNTDSARMEPQGYMRNALAPVRPATLEAPGWYFGDGDLSMPASDLLRWDISIMNRTLLQPASYDAFVTEMKLKDGSPTGYGLGVDVGTRGGHRFVAHTGEVGGFVAANAIFPDDKAAIAVLTNQEASSAASGIARALEPLILESAPASSAGDAAAAQVRSILTRLQQGSLDRSLLTEDCNFYFSTATLQDFSSSLQPLGEIETVTLRTEQLRGGMTFRAFDTTFANGTTVVVTTYTQPNGKLEQFLVEAKS